MFSFETIGVAVYAALVVVLWLATRPGEERRWKFAALSGAASAGLALFINQIIAWLWHRPRPYESHPSVYHLSHSHDPSFPSDHASAAFGIAFGIYFVDRRVGRFFLIVATLIAAGRIVVGAHYLTDVLASVVVAAVAAAIVVRFGRPFDLSGDLAAGAAHRSGGRRIPSPLAQPKRGQLSLRMVHVH